MQKDLLRIIDANLNRSREGLRVCEEIVRFILKDPGLTKELRSLRHSLSRTTRKFPQKLNTLLRCRDIRADVGRKVLTKSRQGNYQDIFFANIQRVKESLRVLEEFSKIFDLSLSHNFARLRFKAYELEKKTVAKL